MMRLDIRNGRPFLYEERRQGGRRTRRYVGSGALALALYADDRRQRKELAAVEADEAAMRARALAPEAHHDAIDGEIASLHDRAMDAARAELAAMGGHDSYRHWRISNVWHNRRPAR